MADDILDQADLLRFQFRGVAAAAQAAGAHPPTLPGRLTLPFEIGAFVHDPVTGQIGEVLSVSLQSDHLTRP